MSNFEYKSISLVGPAFRLLRLLRGNSDPIQCQLIESQLTIRESPTASPEQIYGYAALSYTWGNNSRPCDIIVNGRNMTVTKNAYLALQDLRYQDQNRILWVDALCINQEDKDEQGQQVQQMGSIYSGAKRVIIWLGEATYDTDYIMYYMKQLENEGFKYAPDDLKTSDKQWANLWSVVVRDLRPEQRDLLAEGLQSLLHRNCLRKEICFASVFALMPSLLNITPDPHCQPILDIMPGTLRETSWWAGKQDLYTMLDKFRNSEATDPRDNIYALLGISSNTYKTDLLRADYRRSVEDTIFDTAFFLLDLNKLEPPIGRFFDWTLPEFLGNLDALANKVLKSAKDTGHAPVVRRLLEIGKADANSTDYDSEMLLLWAAENGYDAVVKLLLEKGARPETKDSDSRTPLLCAAANGHEAVLTLLLVEKGVELETKDKSHRRTPLLWAAENGHEAIVRLLIEKGSRLEAKDKSRRTPLLRAARNGHEAVVRHLLEKGADVEAKDKSQGRTSLSWAAEYGHEAVTKLLLDLGAKVETRDKLHGRTSLSWAAEYGQGIITKLLLDNGADWNAEDNLGYPPSSWAAANGHERIVNLLRHRSATGSYR